jgi:hypothetical protein
MNEQLIEFKALLETRLRTLDYRHAEASERERGRIGSEIKRMIQLAAPASNGDEYRGEF